VSGGDVAAVRERSVERAARMGEVPGIERATAPARDAATSADIVDVGDHTGRTPLLGWSDLRRLATAWGERYASNPTYWRIDGRPVCSVLNLTDFAFHYGLGAFGVMLLYLRRRLREAVGVEPYLIGVFSEANARNTAFANRLPLDAATGYALLPTWTGPPLQDYEALIERRVREWYAVQVRLRIPFLPVASAGWDASVRGERLPRLSPAWGFPWVPIVTGVTPARFGRFLDHAIDFNLRMHPETNIVFIHAWNEWTESSVVEPSDRFGRAFLDEISARKDRFHPVGDNNGLAFEV
jgi:hypothetical protein